MSGLRLLGKGLILNTGSSVMNRLKTCFQFGIFVLNLKVGFMIIKERMHMPIVTVQLLEGRTHEQKKAMVEKVTEAIVETTNAPAEKVMIIIEDMPRDHFATAGVLASEC